jgi:hypothetical protein
MINYKKKITLNKHNDLWYIQTDKNDRYETFVIDNINTPWTKWWEMQNQSDLRLWQKEILRDIASKLSDLKPFIVYKKSAGYSQPHDIALAYSESLQIWILITERDFWFIQNDYGQVNFDVEDSMGSILDKNSRLEIGLLRDHLPYS